MHNALTHANKTATSSRAKLGYRPLLDPNAMRHRPSAPGLSRGRRRNQTAQRVVLHVFLTTAWVLLGATQYWSAISDRDSAIRATQATVLNLASSLAQHAGDTFEIADTVLSGLAWWGRDVGMQDEPLSRFLAAEAGRSERIHGLFVYDADGRWVGSSLPVTPTLLNNSDREYFQHHLHNDDDAPYIGPPIRSRSDGSWILTLSRRLEDRQGRFAGVALATIQLEYFERYYRGFNVGSEGTIGMTDLRGDVLVRIPDGAQRSIRDTEVFRLMRSKERGAITYSSPIDGIPRISGFATAPGFPLQILAGFSQREALKSWRHAARQRVVITVLGVALLLGAGIWLDLQLKRAHRNERLLAEQAQVDGLTGIANRRTLDRGLALRVQEASSQARALSLLMIDVDYFKRYNDTYGHAQGDECLKRIAQMLEDNTRELDLVARYGGEEFAVVLSDCDLQTATAQAARLCDAARALALPHAASEVADVVTLSIGVAAMERGQRFTPVELVARADLALYAAKQAGRDRWSAG